MTGSDNKRPQRPSVERDVSLDETLTRAANDPETLAAAAKRKKLMLYGGIGAALLLVVLMIYGCQPKKASMAFGICSTFLEISTPYPQTLNYTQVEGSRTAVRIYFTSTDPFGMFRHEMIECTFGTDPNAGTRITEIKRNRRPIDQAVIQKFNLTIPAIIASDPYLEIPPNWKNQLVPR